MTTPKEQLQAMRRLEENWDGYGAAPPRASAIDLAEEFAGLIEAMIRKSPSAPCTLYVNPTRVGGILLEWEDRSVQHEVDISPDGAIGFLHIDKSTGTIVTRTFSAGSLHPGLLHELQLLLAA